MKAPRLSQDFISVKTSPKVKDFRVNAWTVFRKLFFY